MRVLQIGSDRSKQGTLVADTASTKRQEAYARVFGHIDDISSTLASDPFAPISSEVRSVYPTKSVSRLLYVWDAIRIARTLPRPEVVSAQDPFEAGLAAFFIARHFKVPLHVQVHTDFLAPEYASLSLLNRFRVAIAGFVLQRATRTRVVSRRIEESIKTRYHPRAEISVLPIFVDIERFKNLQQDAVLLQRFVSYSERLLIVSRLEPEKNAALALRAFAEGAPSSACLIVIGSGSESKELQRLAQELGISERVFFEGSKEPSSYYTIAGLVLVTSRYEGYGLVIIEALAAGKPVLSTDVGIAREAGAIVAAPQEFSQALADWFKSGPRVGVLKNPPEGDFEKYVRAYCADIAAARDL